MEHKKGKGNWKVKSRKTRETRKRHKRWNGKIINRLCNRIKDKGREIRKDNRVKWRWTRKKGRTEHEKDDKMKREWEKKRMI